MISHSLSYHSDGCISGIGHSASIEEQFHGATFDKVIDAQGMCVMPGK